MKSNIKYIIFDYGNVLAYPKSGDWFITDMFKKCTENKPLNPDIYQHSIIKCKPILDQVMTTMALEYKMFYDFYKIVINDQQWLVDDKKIKEIAYDRTFNMDNYVLYPDVVEILSTLNKYYKLILLTDNWPSGLEHLKHDDILKCFDKVYISSVYGELKIDGKFFDIVMRDYNIKKGEAIFMDDKEAILDVALSKKLDTILMNRENSIIDSKYYIISNLKGILEYMKELICQSCGMPLKSDSDFGTNIDNTKNNDYCTYCYQKGQFTNDFTMSEMIEHNLLYLKEFNENSNTIFNEETARKEMNTFFPTLKRWQK